jgi:hypothetical protein
MSFWIVPSNGAGRTLGDSNRGSQCGGIVTAYGNGGPVDVACTAVA